MAKASRFFLIIVGVGLGFTALGSLVPGEALPLPSPASYQVRATSIALETQATLTALRSTRAVSSPERSRVQGTSTATPSPFAEAAHASPSALPTLRPEATSTPATAAAACADGDGQPPEFELSRSARRDGRLAIVECPTPLGVGEPRVGWPHEPTGTAWFEAGTYRLFARQPGAFVAIRAPVAAVLSDVTVSATFRKVGGPPGGGFGVIVRDQRAGGGDGVDQRGRYYVLEVGDIGEIGVWRRDDDRWTDLVPWTASPAVRPGNAVNQVTVHAVGSRLTLVVNDVQVAEVEDAALADGAVGMFTGGDLNMVAVSRFRVDSLDLR
jgi:hypothetical protein